MIARRTIGLLLGVLAAVPLCGGVNRWTSNTPPWGPESASGVIVHPRIPGLVFARADGLWRSDDGGANWHRLAVQGSGVQAVAVDPGSADVIYLDAASGGVLRSIDGGRTWTPRAAVGTSPPMLYQLAIPPSAPDTLFAFVSVGELGLHRSRDSGATWQLVLAGTALGGIAFDPSDASIVYVAATDQGVLRSSDGGGHWVPYNTGLGTLSATSISVDGQDPRRLYLVNGGLIYRSTDGGGRWQTAASGIANLVEVSSVPGLANVAYARTGPSSGLDGIVRTTNGGFTWTGVSPPPGVATLYGMAPDPGSADSLYVLTPSVVKTSDAGSTWTTLGYGPAKVGGRALAVSPLEARTLYAAGGLALFSVSSDSGTTWLPSESGTFPSVWTNNLAIAPTTPETVYVGTPSGVFRTLNRGAAWSRVGPFTDSAVVIIDPAHSTSLIAVTSTCIPFFCASDSHRTTDDGATWATIKAFDGSSVAARLFIPTDPPRLLASVFLQPGLLRGDPAGPLVPVPGAPTLTQLAVDPLEPSVIYGVGDFPGDTLRHFFRSNDAGSTWAAVSATPDASILALAINPLDPAHAVIGTDSRGVFQSTDGGATWQPWNDDLPETHIDAVAFSTDGRTLFAGTAHAVYQYTFCENCRRGDAQRPPTQTVPPRSLAPGE